MKIDWKKAIGLTAAVAMLVPLAACGGSSDGDSKSGASGTEDITLSVWAPQEDQAKDTNWLGQVEENFAKDHPEYNITWKNDVVSEGDASKQVSTDPSAAADVYMFASDQLGVLMDAKAIGQLGTDAEKQVKEQNGDLEVDSVTGTDGKLYGVPYTDNTWFMYYNKSKITEDEAKDFDTILSKAKVTFPLQNSWYINGFYDGLSLFGEKGNDADAGMVFPKMFMTTFIIACFTCVISVIFVLSVAYCMSRMRFRVRKTFMNVVLILGMFPGIMAVTAIYFILKALGLSSGAMTTVALILVYSAGSGAGFYVMKGYMDTIPTSLDEAALLDGCTRFQVFYKIIIPICKPMIVYQAIIGFLTPWLDFVMAKVICRTQSNYTVALGLWLMLQKEYIQNWYARFAAAAVVISIPIAILFIVMQRFYQESMAGSVKG